MKVIIWISSLFVCNLILRIINTPVESYLSNNYYNVASMIWAVGSVVATEGIGILIAKKLCDVYEQHKIKNSAVKSGIKTFDMIKSTIPETLLEEFEECRGDIERLNKSINYWETQDVIDNMQAKIIYDEFSKH